MRLFKYTLDSYHYAQSGNDETEARKELAEFLGVEEKDLTLSEEILKDKWDEKTITCYEDNNIENEPFMISINDIIDSKYPMIVFTNDRSWE